MEKERKRALEKAAPRISTAMWMSEDRQSGYHMDRRGDQDNLVYGSLHRGDIARYLRFERICLGMMNADVRNDISARRQSAQVGRYWGLRLPADKQVEHITNKPQYSVMRDLGRAEPFISLSKEPQQQEGTIQYITIICDMTIYILIYL